MSNNRIDPYLARQMLPASTAVPVVSHQVADDDPSSSAFSHAPDTKLDNEEETQVLHRAQHKHAHRKQQHGNRARGAAQEEQLENQEHEDETSIVPLDRPGDARQEDEHGSSQQRDRRGRNYEDGAAVRRIFEQAMGSLPHDAADQLRTVAVNLRGLPDEQAAPQLAAALAQVMLRQVNAAESDRLRRNALVQLLKQLAIRKLLQDSRLKLRTTVRGAKAALLAAEVPTLSTWQRSDEGDNARVLLPLVFIDACRRHNADNGFSEA